VLKKCTRSNSVIHSFPYAHIIFVLPGASLKIPFLTVKPSDLYKNKSIQKFADRNWDFYTLPGQNAARWPEGMDAMIEKLLDHRFLQFFNEPLEIHQTFHKKKSQFIQTTLLSLKSSPHSPTHILHLAKATLINLLLSLLSGNFNTYLDDLNLFDQIHTLTLPEAQQKIFTSYLTKNLNLV
jgi:hypothetical protein